MYETYVDALLKRRWSEDTDYIPPQDRFFFVQELAWEMYQTQRPTIPFSEFPERVTMHFGLKDDPERAAFFERDVRTQSYLVRDDAGNYRFAHKSFMEYFVARKMVNAISDPDFDVDKAIEVWKTQPLTPEVRDFLLPMVPDPDLLWRLIEMTRGKTMTDVGYTGGDAATLLQVKGESFANRELDHAVLIGADLTNVDITNANLRGADLRHSVLSNVTLVDSDFRNVDLRGAKFYELRGVRRIRFSNDENYLASADEGGHLIIWSLATRSPEQVFKVSTHPLDDLCWGFDKSIGSEVIITGSNNGKVTLWEMNGRRIMWEWQFPYQPDILLRYTERATCRVQFSPDNRAIVAGFGEYVVVLDAMTGVTMAETQFPGIRDLALSADGELLAVACHTNSVYLLSLDHMRIDRAQFIERRVGNLVISVDISPGNRYVCFGGNRNHYGVLDVKQNRVLRYSEAPLGPSQIGYKPRGYGNKNNIYIKSTAFHPREEIIAWGNEESCVGVFDFAKTISQGEVIGRHRRGDVMSVTFSPSGHWLASGGQDGTIMLWDYEQRQLVDVLEFRLNCRGMLIAGCRGLEEPVELRNVWNRSTRQYEKQNVSIREFLLARGAVE